MLPDVVTYIVTFSACDTCKKLQNNFVTWQRHKALMFGLLEKLWFTILPEFTTYNAAVNTGDPGVYWQLALGLLVEA